MNYDYPPEEKDCICRYCGEESDGEFCNGECAKEYKADN